MPVIAEAQSYRSFMGQVEQRIKPEDKLYLFGESFNSDSVVFYHGRPIEMIDQSPEEIAAKIAPGLDYIIMAQRSWAEIQDHDRTLPEPLLSSTSTGPEGDAPLVLVRSGDLLSTGQSSGYAPVEKALVAFRPFNFINER